MVGYIRDGEESTGLVENFVVWCEFNHLQLNPSKTKELVVDLRRPGTPRDTSRLQEADVDIVQV